MKYLFFLFSVLFSILTLNAQTLLIKDYTTGQALEGVQVVRNTTSVIGYTNSKGALTLREIGNEDSLTISYLGYATVTYSFSSLTNMGFRLQLKESIHLHDEIIVSASKFEEKKSDIPQQSLVISQKELQFSNQSTTADVMQQTGYALVQKSQAGGGSPILRGFEANKVLLVIDGVRMNNAIYRGGHLQNILTIDNSMLSKTEVLFGPSSVIYGSDALGGVMHFYTKDPLLADSSSKQRITGSAFSRLGSVNKESTSHVDFSVGLKKLAFLTSLTFYDFGDLTQGKNRNPFYPNWGKDSFYVDRINNTDSMVTKKNDAVQKNTGYSQFDFMEKILYQPSSKLAHVLNLQYSTSSDIVRYDRTSLLSGTQPKYGKWYYGPQKRLMGSYTLRLDAKTKAYSKARVVAAYQSIEESRHDRRFKQDTINHRTENVCVYSLNLDFSKELKKHELRYGAEVFYNIVQSKATKENILNNYSAPTDTRYPNGSTYMSIAAYITHAWELSKKWIFTDGIRFSSVQLNADFIDTSFFNFPKKNITQKNQAFNGSIGTVFQPGKDWRFSMLFSSGFRAPNVDDMGKVFESTAGDVILPNPSLKPEYTYNGELSITKLFYKSFRIEATGYSTYYQNVIITDKSTYNGSDSILYQGTLSQVRSNQNKREAYLLGTSVGIGASLNEHLDFKSTFNYTYGRILTDSIHQPLDHIAPVFGRASLLYKAKKIKSELFIIYNGWKRVSDYQIKGEDNFDYATPVGTPSWYTINARGSYFVNSYLVIQLAIENILDTHYRVFSSGISAPGRNFSITLRGSF